MGGRRRPPVRSPLGRLVREAVAIAVVVALAVFLVYHFTVRTIRNTRPLGGVNVDVSRAPGIQSEAAIAVDPRDPQELLAASNDSLLPTLRVYTSSDGGRTWRRAAGPAVPGNSCAHGEPRVAVDADGRQYLAFLAGRTCGDKLTPYLIVASRPDASARWTLRTVTHPAWKYGFDDGPALAVDTRTGDVYVAFTRSLSINHATTQWSVSRDHGATWSAPATVSRSLVRPHLASLAVASDGDVYLAGIDASARNLDRALDRRRTELRRSRAGGAARPEPRLRLRALRVLAAAAGGPPLHRARSHRRRAQGPGRRRLRRRRRERGGRRLPRRADAGAAAALPNTGEPGRQGEDRPVPAGGGRRPLDGQALGLLVRHDVRPARTPGLVHVLRLPRRADVDAAGAGGERADGARWISSASPRRTGSIRRSRRRPGAAHPLWPDGRAIPLSIDVFTAALR